MYLFMSLIGVILGAISAAPVIASFVRKIYERSHKKN